MSVFSISLHKLPYFFAAVWEGQERTQPHLIRNCHFLIGTMTVWHHPCRFQLWSFMAKFETLRPTVDWGFFSWKTEKRYVLYPHIHCVHFNMIRTFVSNITTTSLIDWSNCYYLRKKSPKPIPSPLVPTHLSFIPWGFQIVLPHISHSRGIEDSVPI